MCAAAIEDIHAAGESESFMDDIEIDIDEWTKEARDTNQEKDTWSNWPHSLHDIIHAEQGLRTYLTETPDHANEIRLLQARQGRTAATQTELEIENDQYIAYVYSMYGLPAPSECPSAAVSEKQRPLL